MEDRETARMRKLGKVKRLELWWQLYRTSLPVWYLENFRPMDFCWHECTINLKFKKILPSAHIVFLCFVSQKKQWSFHYTAVADWFLQPRRQMFTSRCKLGLYINGLDFALKLLKFINHKQFKYIYTHKQ